VYTIGNILDFFCPTRFIKFPFRGFGKSGISKELEVAKGYRMGCEVRGRLGEFKGFKGICGLLFVFPCFEEFSVYLGSDCGLGGRGQRGCWHYGDVWMFARWGV